MSYGLSKTKILYSLQCPKRLWLEVHQPDLAQYSEVSIQMMNTGNDVRRVHRELISNGILVGHVDDLEAALNQTDVALKQSGSAPVLEGAFQHEVHSFELISFCLTLKALSSSRSKPPDR